MSERCRAAFVASILALTSVQSRASGCDLAAGESGRVAEVVDGETLRLEGGLVVRLVGAMAPARPAGLDPDVPWRGGDRAREMLERLAAGKTVRLFHGGPRRDRHGRALAHVFVSSGADRRWLQGEMVEAGFALAYSFSDQQACLADLLARERRARAGGLGLWAGGGFAVVDALEAERLFYAVHRFVIVEGKVHAVAEVRGRVYLNFETDWRHDFTVSIGPRHRKAFVQSGVDPARLAGRRVRVRGWVARRNGPMIEADHAGQIEVLD